MKPLPYIHLIYASDAPQILEKLKKILHNLKAENRLKDISTIDFKLAPGKLNSQVSEDDLIIILLTHELEAFKTEISKIYKNVIIARPGIKIAELIIDQVPYENEFINFPYDLKPLRNRNDLNIVWQEIEQSLREILPETQSEKKPLNWKKYARIGSFALAGILLIGLIQLFFSGSAPVASFNYKVLDPISGNLYSDTSECYLPCLITFNNRSKNYDHLAWNFGDTVRVGEENPDYLFVKAGEHKIILTASTRNRENSFEKTLLVKAPPVAGFEIINNGCMAPCQVGFSNISENAEKFAWEFGDGLARTDEKEPSKNYESSGEFKVKLTAINKDGMRNDTIRTVIIRNDNSPFAHFDILYNGPIGKIPQKITFNNLSKNAAQYEWDFGDGKRVTTSNSTPVTNTYNSYGSYDVELTVRQGNRTNSVKNKVVISKILSRRHLELYDRTVIDKIQNNPKFKRQLEVGSVGLVNQ